MTDPILNDPREIESIFWSAENATIMVGGSVEAIRVCEVNGHMAPLAWFEVIANGLVVARYNSIFVEGVTYKKEPEMTSSEEQGALIDVHPENEKEILEAARKYKEAVSERIGWLDTEVKSKERILELAKEAGLNRDEDGSISFSLDGVKIKITPQNDKISVKFPKDEEE